MWRICFATLISVFIVSTTTTNNNSNNTLTSLNRQLLAVGLSNSNSRLHSSSANFYRRSNRRLAPSVRSATPSLRARAASELLWQRGSAGRGQTPARSMVGEDGRFHPLKFHRPNPTSWNWTRASPVVAVESSVRSALTLPSLETAQSFMTFQQNANGSSVKRRWCGALQESIRIEFDASYERTFDVEGTQMAIRGDGLLRWSVITFAQKCKEAARPVSWLLPFIRLDTIAKLLHTHPLSTGGGGQQRPFGNSVIDLHADRDGSHSPSSSSSTNGGMRTRSLNWNDRERMQWNPPANNDPGIAYGLNSHYENPSVVGWRRRHRVPPPYHPTQMMRNELRERIQLYQSWMSTKQWKQFVTGTLPGQTNTLFNLALFEAAVVGVRRAVAECRYQFRHERWNCSQVQNDNSVLFGNILLKGIPQTAFVYSIINAGIVQAVSEACLGQIDNCPCNNRGRETASEASWQWQGCDHNIHYGRRFSRRLLDTMEDGAHVRYQMNLHNNRVGRLLVTKNMERYCRCHGTSGSCALRTCYRRTPRMRTVGNQLKLMHDRNLVRLESDGQPRITHGSGVNQTLQNAFQNDRSHRANKFTRRTWPRRRRRVRSPWYQRNTRLVDNPRIPAIHAQKPTRKYVISTNRTRAYNAHLVYYESLPPNIFCESKPSWHIPGTRDRVCNSTSSGPDNCQHLCCGRGYVTHHYYAMESCHCKFIWCCRVKCQQCLVLKRMETCI